MNTNEGETVRDVCAKMLEPSSTCRACDFTQCPMLVKFAAEVKEAYAREMAAKDAEIARLRAALKPVMECRIERIDGIDSPDGDFMTSSEYGVCDADGNEVDNHSIASSLNAVREAQRVMREGGEK